MGLWQGTAYLIFKFCLSNISAYIVFLNKKHEVNWTISVQYQQHSLCCKKRYVWWVRCSKKSGGAPPLSCCRAISWPLSKQGDTVDAPNCYYIGTQSYYILDLLLLIFGYNFFARHQRDISFPIWKVIAFMYFWLHWFAGFYFWMITLARQSPEQTRLPEKHQVLAKPFQ